MTHDSYRPPQRRPHRTHAPRTLVAVTALPLLLLALAGPPRTSTLAQSPPASYYGIASAGDRIEARHNGVACAQATAAADGFWLLTVSAGGACGIAEGGTLSFARNGLATPAVETWRPGGVPANVTAGVSLGPPSVAGTATPVPTASGAPALSGGGPLEGGAALLVTTAAATPTALRGVLAADGCAMQALAVLEGGRWSVYLEGAPPAVNLGFPSSLPPGSAFFVRC